VVHAIARFLPTPQITGSKTDDPIAPSHRSSGPPQAAAELKRQKRRLTRVHSDPEQGATTNDAASAA